MEKGKAPRNSNLGTHPRAPFEVQSLISDGMTAVQRCVSGSEVLDCNSIPLVFEVNFQTVGTRINECGGAEMPSSNDNECAMQELCNDANNDGDEILMLDYFCVWDGVGRLLRA